MLICRSISTPFTGDNEHPEIREESYIFDKTDPFHQRRTHCTAKKKGKSYSSLVFFYLRKVTYLIITIVTLNFQIFKRESLEIYRRADEIIWRCNTALLAMLTKLQIEKPGGKSSC